jgi:hypothetical protein
MTIRIKTTESLSLIERAQFESSFDYICKWANVKALESLLESVKRDEEIIEIKKRILEYYLTEKNDV